MTDVLYLAWRYLAYHRVKTLVLVLAVAGCAKDAPQASTPAKMSAAPDIVAVAAGAGQFNTLVAAVKAADLVATLQSPGPFTVFAPTDEAFAKLPAGTVDSLLLPENKDKLVGILTYHVVSGKVMAEDVVDLTSAKTVQGNEVKIVVEAAAGQGSVEFPLANVTTSQ